MRNAGTVIVVDDEPFILEATARLLRGAGYEVHTCDQWAGVANVVRSVTPPLILLDYNMPTLKGDNVCMILKRTMAQSGVRILLHPSESEEDLARIVARCGADGYLPRSCPANELLGRVEAELALVRAEGSAESDAR